MKSLQGKVALITGAARGIGRGSATVLARRGARVLGIDTAERSEELEALRNELDGQCKTFTADAFAPEGREAIMRFASDAETALDILVTNPCSSAHHPVTEFPFSEFQRVINASLTSHFHMAQLAAERMVKDRARGKIIFISSVYGSLNREHSVAYDAGKAGINQMVRVFARELARNGITVNAVAPGFTDTPGERVYMTEEECLATGHDLPLGRASLPEDIGNAVAFLASEDAAMITGHVLTVDGGMSLCDFSYERPSNSP